MKNKLIKYGSAAAIAVASVFALGYGLGDAVQIAFDLDKAVEACEAILKGQ